MGELHVDYFNYADESHFGPEGKVEVISSQTDFAFGMEILQFISRDSKTSPYQPKIALGAKLYKSYLHFIDPKISEYGADYGLLFSVRPINVEFIPELGINLDVSLGYTKINFTEEEFEYKFDNDGDGQTNEDHLDLLDNDGDGLIDEDQIEEPLYMETGEALGFAAKLSIPVEKIDFFSSSIISNFADNILSVMIGLDKYRGKHDNQDYEDYYNQDSTGLEITIFDLLAYRCSLSDSSYGFGLDMDITKHWTIQTNMAVGSNGDANSYDVVYRYKF